MFQIKQGDRLPILSGQALGPVGDPIDVASAPYPRFLMRATGLPSPIISATAGATITNASQGQIAYLWAAGETATVGLFEGEFELTFPGPKTQTVPGGGYIPINVKDDIG